MSVPHEHGAVLEWCKSRDMDIEESDGEFVAKEKGLILRYDEGYIIKIRQSDLITAVHAPTDKVSVDGSSLIIGSDDDKTVLETTRWPQLSTGERALSAVLGVVVLSMAGYMAGTGTELPKFVVAIPLILLILLGVYQFVREDRVHRQRSEVEGR